MKRSHLAGQLRLIVVVLLAIALAGGCTDPSAGERVWTEASRPQPGGGDLGRLVADPMASWVPSGGRLYADDSEPTDQNSPFRPLASISRYFEFGGEPELWAAVNEARTFAASHGWSITDEPSRDEHGGVGAENQVGRLDVVYWTPETALSDGFPSDPPDPHPFTLAVTLNFDPQPPPEVVAKDERDRATEPPPPPDPDDGP